MLYSCPAASAKFPSPQAELGRQWSNQNPNQPNSGLRTDESPCTAFSLVMRLFIPTHLDSVELCAQGAAVGAVEGGHQVGHGGAAAVDHRGERVVCGVVCGERVSAAEAVSCGLGPDSIESKFGMKNHLRLRFDSLTCLLVNSPFLPAAKPCRSMEGKPPPPPVCHLSHGGLWKPKRHVNIGNRGH